MYFKEIRQAALEYVIWLCISVLLYNSSIFIPYNKNDPNDILCATQSFMITCFQNSIYLWCCIIGFIAYTGAKNQVLMESYEKVLRFVFILIAILLPMLLAAM